MKQRSMRKLLSWALMLAMLLTMLPTAAFAEEVPLVGEIAPSEVGEEEVKPDLAEIPAEETPVVELSQEEATLFEASAATFTVIADKVSAKPGERITFTVKASFFVAPLIFSFDLDIPAGLTYIKGSGELDSNFENTTGMTTASVSDYEDGASFRAFCHTASLNGLNDLALMSFQCVVDDPATADTYEVGLEELNFWDESDDITSQCTVKRASVEIDGVAKVGSTIYSSFADAVTATANATSATTIELVGSETFTSPTTCKLNKYTALSVPVGKNVTLSGPLTIDGEKKSHSANPIVVAGTLTLKNGVVIDGIVNGTTSTNGAFRVTDSGTLNLDGAIVQNCSGRRGAIYLVTGAKVNISNSTLKNNASVKVGDSAAQGGGAIYAYGSTSVVTVENTSFIGNSSAVSGGAIIANTSAATGPVINLTNCTFTNNTATGDGGAVCITKGRLNVNGATMSGNTAGEDMNDIHIANGSFVLEGAVDIDAVSLATGMVITLNNTLRATGTIELANVAEGQTVLSGSAVATYYEKFRVADAALVVGKDGVVAKAQENTTRFAGGHGTASSPYLIANATHLNNVRNYLDAHFKMTADIVFTDADFAEGGAFYNNGAGWKPIGDYNKKFTGSFDGDGHTITGLKQNISGSSTVYGGLFGYVYSATIKNLGMCDSCIAASTSSTSYAGGIAGYASAGTLGVNINNCYNTGAIKVASTSAGLSAYAGGIVGYASSGTITISNCRNTGAVTAASLGTRASANAAGIAGYVSADVLEISDCQNSGEVTASTDSSRYTACAGGIVSGTLSVGNLTISNCHNTGAIKATATDWNAYAGGIVGDAYNDGAITINKCSNAGVIESTATESNAYAGGIVCNASGADDGDIAIGNCYNTGAITTSSSSFSYAGGIAGRVENATISTCHNTGTVTAVSSSSFVGAGGIAGDVDGNIAISECYNTGVVTAESSSSSADAGGIAGHVRRSATISNCYNTGTVTAATSSSSSSSSYAYAYAGGIIGYVYNSGVTISNCYNTGTVTATSSALSSSAYAYAGGIAGYVRRSATISNCYNTSVVSASSSSSASADAGGIAGYASSGTIDNCYYLNTCIAGIGNKTGGAIKCAVAEMREQTTFGGFDFTDVWTMSGHEEYLYPKLKAVPMFFEEELAGITVLTLPNKTTYIEGTAFDSTGLVVAKYYTGGRTVVVTPDSVSGYTATVGTDTITVAYGDYTDTFEVEVVAKSVASIEVAAPTKLSYLEAKDVLDVSGGKVTVYYNNDTSEVIDLTADMVNGFDNAVVGEQAVMVYYKGYTDTFDVTIVAKSEIGIEVAAPSKTGYLEAKETLKVDGGKVTVYYNNDTSEVIDLTVDMVSGFDNTAVGKQTLTVTYEGFTDTFEVEIIAKSLASIGAAAPIKTNYLEAKETFDVTGGKVTLRYNNDTSEEIALEAEMISGFDNTVVGKQTLTVTYEGFTTTFEIEIVAKSVMAIGVIPPAKLTYIEAKEAFDPAGGSVVVFYNNGTSGMIDLSTDMVSGFDNTVVGEQTVTVTYGGFTDSFRVEIIAKSVVFVALTTEPAKLAYFEGDALDVSGGKVSVSYNNGTGETIDLAADMVSGFDNTVVGKQILTVSYGGKTDTFEIEVIVKPVTAIGISSVSTTSVTLTIANNEAGKCYVAIYSNEGKMLSYGLATVTADAGEVTVSITPFTTTSQYTVKAFLVDTQGIPVCESAEQ